MAFFSLALASTVTIFVEPKTYEPHVSLSWFITPFAIECITVDGSKVQSYVLFDSLSQVIIKLGCSLDLKCRCLWIPIILLRIRYWSFFSGSLDLPHRV